MNDTTVFSHIWQVFVESNMFNFAIFLAILVWIFNKINIKGIINSLPQKIVAIIEAAQKSKEEAHQKLNEAEKEVENLDSEIQEIIHDATKSAEVIGEKIFEDAKKQVENIELNATKIIEAEGKMLISKLTNRASKASVEVAKKHIEKVLEQDSKLHEKYINESIDSLDRLSF